MKTIILCGGKGIRLYEETEFRPKPMVYVGDKPIIWHIMKIYAHYGYNEFVLALGYKAEFIKDFFLNQKVYTTDFTLKTKDHTTRFYFENRTEVDEFVITFVDTGPETLIGERILRCQKYIPKNDKYFMVTYGDGVSDLNIEKLIDFHKKQGTIGTITGVHPRSKFGLVKVDKNNLVKKFVEKPTVTDWVSGGYMVFKRDFFNYLRVGEMEHPALMRLAKEKELSLYQHDGFWDAVDTFKELEGLRTLWALSNPPWRVWK